MCILSKVKYSAADKQNGPAQGYQEKPHTQTHSALGVILPVLNGANSDATEYQGEQDNHGQDKNAAVQPEQVNGTSIKTILEQSDSSKV
jgi:hypothetical protein